MKKYLLPIIVILGLQTSWTYNQKDLETIKNSSAFAYKAQSTFNHAKQKQKNTILNQRIPAEWANGKFADLKGADLSNLDMSGIWLRSADFTGATFTGSDISDSIFDGVIFNGATFKNADLSNATFNDCPTTNADFMNANTEGARINGSTVIPRIKVECQKGLNTTMHNSQCPSGNYLNFCHCFYSPKTQTLECDICSEEIGIKNDATNPEGFKDNFSFKNLKLEKIVNDGLLYTKNIDLSPDGKLFESGQVIEKGWEECVKDVNTIKGNNYCPAGDYLNYCAGCSYNGKLKELKCLVCNDVIEQKDAERAKKANGENIAIVQTEHGALAHYVNRVLTNIEPVFLEQANIIFDTNGQLRKGVNLTKSDKKKIKAFAILEGIGIAVGAIAGAVLLYQGAKLYYNRALIKQLK